MTRIDITRDVAGAALIENFLHEEEDMWRIREECITALGETG